MRVCIIAALLPLLLGACGSGLHGPAGSARVHMTSPKAGGTYTAPRNIPVVGGGTMRLQASTDGGYVTIGIPRSKINF